MGWFLAGAALLLASILAVNTFMATPAHRSARAVAVACAFVAGALLFWFASRFGPLLAAAAGGVIYFAFRPQIQSLLKTLGNSGGAASPLGSDGQDGRQSKVETASLSMTLDHATGNMDGAVLTGKFAGKALSSLAVPDIAALYRQCRDAGDQESLLLIEKYIERHRADEMDEFLRAKGRGPSSGDASDDEDAARMSEREAYEVLGLQPGADEAAIRRAHKNLMMKFHPDQEGSDYLARKINQARDALLKSGS